MHPKQRVADEEITELGKKVHEIMNSPMVAGPLIRELNNKLDTLAARIVSEGQFTAENISTREELDPHDQMAAHFWSTRALLMSQVFAETIRTIAYFR